MPYISLRIGWIKECRRDSLTSRDWLLKSLMVSSGEITDCQICLLVSEDYTTAAWHVKVITSRFCFSSSCWKNKVQLRGVMLLFVAAADSPHAWLGTGVFAHYADCIQQPRLHDKHLTWGILQKNAAAHLNSSDATSTERSDVSFS